MIEYIPGEHCWRPVDAAGYMFIHCIFLGFKKKYKEKGYGSRLIDECENDAKDKNMKGYYAFGITGFTIWFVFFFILRFLTLN